MARTTIPAAEHFSARTTVLLDRAEALCRKDNLRLTTLRRQVLGMMLDADRPLGAYDLLERLQASHAGAAPPTVYRTLDFLLELGLIHRIERLSSFVPCTHILAPDCGHDDCDHDHSHEGDSAHAIQFLICRNCSKVAELEDPDIRKALVTASRRVGFRVQHSTIEIEGLCAACAASAPLPAES